MIRLAPRPRPCRKIWCENMVAARVAENSQHGRHDAQDQLY
jgi:hypothetical protein